MLSIQNRYLKSVALLAGLYRFLKEFCAHQNSRLRKKPAVQLHTPRAKARCEEDPRTEGNFSAGSGLTIRQEKNYTEYSSLQRSARMCTTAEECDTTTMRVAYWSRSPSSAEHVNNTLQGQCLAILCAVLFVR